MSQPRRVLHIRRDFIAILAGHSDVDQHDVGRFRVQAGDRLIAVADGNHLHVLVGEGQLDDPLNRHAVVSKQQLVGHLGRIGLILDSL